MAGNFVAYVMVDDQKSKSHSGMSEKPESVTVHEWSSYTAVHKKDKKLRDILAGFFLPQEYSPERMFSYLVSVKDALGNLNNDISFVATLLAKDYLARRFSVSFDAARKPQGAPGLDIEIKTQTGLVIIGEIKTTDPYQPGFGAKQKEMIHKDLRRLEGTYADHRFMFVTNDETFRILCNTAYRDKYPSVEIINLISRQSSL